MKRLAGMILCSMLIGMTTARGGDVSPVTVTGTVPAGVLSGEQAKALLERSARRAAVLAGGRDALARYADDTEAALIREAILARSGRLLAKERWQAVTTKDGSLRVPLTATVLAGDLVQELVRIAGALRRKGRPRLALVTREDEVPEALGRGVLSREVEGYFLDRGVQLVDTAAVKAAMAREAGDLFTQPAAASALGRRLGTDLVVTLVGRVRPGPKQSLYGIETASYAVEGQLRAVDQHLGRVVASRRVALRSRSLPADRAGTQLQALLGLAGRDLGMTGLGAILAHWVDRLGVTQIVLAGASSAHLKALKEALATLGGRQSFTIRSHREGTALVEFASDASLDAIAGQLESQARVPLKITDRLESKLVCQVLGTAAAATPPPQPGQGAVPVGPAAGVQPGAPVASDPSPPAGPAVSGASPMMVLALAAVAALAFVGLALLLVLLFLRGRKKA